MLLCCQLTLFVVLLVVNTLPLYCCNPASVLLYLINHLMFDVWTHLRSLRSRYINFLIIIIIIRWTSPLLKAIKFYLVRKRNLTYTETLKKWVIFYAEIPSRLWEIGKKPGWLLFAAPCRFGEMGSILKMVTSMSRRILPILGRYVPCVLSAIDIRQVAHRVLLQRLGWENWDLYVAVFVFKRFTCYLRLWLCSCLCFYRCCQMFNVTCCAVCICHILMKFYTYHYCLNDWLNYLITYVLGEYVEYGRKCETSVLTNLANVMKTFIHQKSIR